MVTIKKMITIVNFMFYVFYHNKSFHLKTWIKIPHELINNLAQLQEQDQLIKVKRIFLYLKIENKTFAIIIIMNLGI